MTRPKILLREMSVAVGDPAQPDAIAASRQAIMDLGLFTSVRTQLVPEADGEGVILRVMVEEKRYVLPLPRGDLKLNGDLSYGAELRLDNLRGLNQRLRLGYEQQSDVADRDPTRELFLSFNYPRIGNSLWDLALAARVIRRDLALDEDGTESRYQHDDRSTSFFLGRWLNESGASSGWRVGGGLSYQEMAYDLRSGTPGRLQDSAAVSANASVEYLDIHDYPFHRSGTAFGYYLTAGLPFMGSDYDHHRHLFVWRKYNPLGERGKNLNLRAQVGLADGDLFGSKAYGLGGAKSLRGHEGMEPGNAMLLLNVEYLSPFVRRFPQLRWVAFVDVGNVYRSASHIDLTDLEVGFGVGLRWRVQTFVDVTLSADVGFGGESVKYYGSTSDSF